MGRVTTTGEIRDEHGADVQKLPTLVVVLAGVKDARLGTASPRFARDRHIGVPEKGLHIDIVRVGHAATVTPERDVHLEFTGVVRGGHTEQIVIAPVVIVVPDLDPRTANGELERTSVEPSPDSEALARWRRVGRGLGAEVDAR